jgi:sulfate adenylyltransferase subunit 2
MFNLTFLEQLEAESIDIFRIIASSFENPVMMYSVGKDSSVLLHLAHKAFYPGKIPFPILHVDTGFKFKEMYEFRDRKAKEYNLDLIVHRNEPAIKNNTNPFDLGTSKCCALLKTESLLQALKKGNYDCAIGGARRDEEKSRAKERFFSFRDKNGVWDPKNQRPEIWDLYNTFLNSGDSIRAFPISNWTEMNVWQYIKKENIEIVPLYYALKRKVVVKRDLLIPLEVQSDTYDKNDIQEVECRFRTLGCSPCTGAMRSSAKNIDEIIQEVRAATLSERSTRVIDHDKEGSMEMKKREGYF